MIRIHPQVWATMQQIERMRRARRVQRLEIRFGPNGIERTWADGFEVFQLKQGDSETKLDTGTAIPIELP